MEVYFWHNSCYEEYKVLYTPRFYNIELRGETRHNYKTQFTLYSISAPYDIVTFTYN